MPIKWKLRECLEERGITSASQVSKLVRNRTGYVLSTQAVCDLFNEQPKMIRLETSEALCNAFHCCLNDFVEVVPKRVYNSPANKPRVLKTANLISGTPEGAAWSFRSRTSRPYYRYSWNLANYGTSYRM
jgi:DNA-binding Xre family transcriptional regulator